MSSEGIGSSKSPSTSPIAAILQVTAADKLLLSRMQTFVSLSIVLASKCFATNATHEWALIRVGAQM
jgi:hypothetical protein